MGADLKFIHCSDLHLGSRFVGISDMDPELGRRLTESTFASFGNIVDLAISEKADLMVISGDIFDEENETPSTRYRFAKELERLKIPCFISLGNHDFKRSWETSIPYPSNVHVFSNDPESITVDIGGNDVEVIGRSFSSRHTTENLAGSLRGSSNIFTIGVVHCSVDPSSEDDRYAPCRLADLLGKNVDYWALGHIHKRSILYKQPHIVYPGNTQGRNSKETGEKGAYLVTVRNGSVIEMGFVPTQDILWQDIVIDITGKSYGDVLDEITTMANPRSVLSLKFIGRGEMDSAIRLHTSELIKQISLASRCTVSSVDAKTSAGVDLSDLNPNDLFSKIACSVERTYSLSRADIIDMICSTKMSQDVRHVFESMSDDDLRSLVNDSGMFLIDMLSEDPQ